MCFAVLIYLCVFYGVELFMWSCELVNRVIMRTSEPKMRSLRLSV